jgi:aconitate decarboxylase
MPSDQTVPSALILAERIAASTFDEIELAARDYARILILDLVGNALAGSALNLSHGLLDAAKGWGSGDIPVWGDGTLLPAPDAVLVNVHRAHCLEFDAFNEAAVVHPVTVVLPCALAMVTKLRQQGRVVTGRELLRAVVIGVDTASAVGIAATETLRFFRPATAGAFGGVAAIAALAGWPAERTLKALGLVLGFTSGTMQAHEEGSSAMALIVGMNGRAAMTAADLSLVDFHPPRDVFEGKFGFYNVIEAGGDIEAFRKSIPSIGTGRNVLGTAIKPYPSGRATHGAIYAMEQIALQRSMTASEVDSVLVEVPPLIASLVGRPVVADMAVNYARLSLPYLAARFLLDGRIDTDSFGADAMCDPGTAEQARKVEIRVKDTGNPNAFNPHEVTVRFLDGGIEHLRVDHVLGAPDCPLPPERVRNKFRRNARDAAHPLSAGQIDAIEEMIFRLDTLDDATGLVAAISGPVYGD